MPISFSKRLVSYFFLSINTLTWGLALIIVKPSLSDTTPFRFLLYRFILAALCSFPILLYYWPKVRQKIQSFKKILLVEFFGTTLALGLLYLGLARTSAIEASFLTTTTPIFVVLAGVFYLREKEEKKEMAGLLLAFLGTLLLTLIPVILNGSAIQQLSLKGNMLIILQNIATAIGMILAKKHYNKLPKLFVTGIGFYVGIISFLLLSLLELNFSLPNLWSAITTDLQQRSVLIASGYMAIFGSIIGLTAYIKGQDGIEASEASLFWYLQPLVFIPAGYFLLNESIHPLQVVAILLILCGVFIAETKRKKLKH